MQSERRPGRSWAGPFLLAVALGAGVSTVFGCGQVTFGDDLDAADGGGGTETPREDAAAGSPDVPPRDTGVAPSDGCEPQPSPALATTWPFEGSADTYAKVFSLVTTSSDCSRASCHGPMAAESSLLIPSQALLPTRHAEAANKLWTAFSTGGFAQLSTESTAHAFWTHAHAGDNHGQAFTADDIAAMDTFIRYARSCAVATATWQAPLCSEVASGGDAAEGGDADSGSNSDSGADAGVCYCEPPSPELDVSTVCPAP